MPLPLLGAVAAVGKGLVIGGAKAVAVGAKIGAKAAVSSGKFFAKGGANLARGGAKVARQGGKQVVKGAKFFKQKVSSVKEKGGNIANKLKQNASNIRESLKTGNKNQEKLRTKKQQRKQKEKSIRKKREKEKQLESKKSSSDQNKRLQSIAKSPLDILNKIFSLGGLLLGGILVNAFEGIKKKAEEFYNNNKELFDTIGNFLSGVKDAAVGLFDSFTGPYSEEGAFDDFAKFDDNGKLQSGALKKVEDAYNGFGDLINTIDKALGGKGTAGDIFKTDTTSSTPMPSREELVNQTERRSGMASFREDTAENAALQRSVMGTDYTEEDEDGSVSAAGETAGNIISGYPITSDYGYRTHPVTGEAGKLHGGIDVGTPQGTPISLVEDGMIVAAGEYGGYGYMIDAWLPNSGVQIRLAHLSEIIKNSGTFKANEILGKTGGAAGSRGAGSSTGPHLHFEADTEKGAGRYGGSGNPKNYSKLLRLGSFQPNKTSDGKGGVISPIASTPKEKIATISQPDPTDEGGETIFIQRVNTIQYIPVPS